VVSMEQGADLLADILGPAARTAFAVAMLCAGQSSSLTGVLSSQCAPPPPAAHSDAQVALTLLILELGVLGRRQRVVLQNSCESDWGFGWSFRDARRFPSTRL
jgi:Mn2+/Fe2+ NRAMP family transporter